MTLALPQAGKAQADIVLATLEINLWPEYDRSDMLVIYKITLLPESVPADLTFRIPQAAGEPYKVATWAEDGNLYETPYTFSLGSEWSQVNFRANATEFQIEYYDPRLQKSVDGKHSFSYTWPGDYTVNSAAIVVQQPQDASQMQFTPSNVTSFKGVDDLVYYADQIGKLGKGQTYDFSLSYIKTTNVLTFEKQQVRPTTSLPQSMWNRGLPWALGVLALLLISGGVWIYWRSGQPQSGERRRKRRKVTSQAGGEAAVEDTGAYCHICGRRATPGDTFCRSCGTKLRV